MVIVAVKADNNHWLHSEEWIRRMKTIDPFQHVQHVRNVNCWVILGMNAIAAPSALSHQQYSNPIRGSASTSSDKVTPFSRPSTPPVARHSEISSLHLFQRPRPMPFSMAVAIAVSQIITEIDGDGDFHTSGQFRSTHGRLVLVRADGQIVICDTHILQSTHTHKHT